MDLVLRQQISCPITNKCVSLAARMLFPGVDTGIPSILQEIGRVIAQLREAGGMAILLVEQYYAFARELAQGILVMDRGSVVLAGRADALDEEEVRGRMMV